MCETFFCLYVKQSLTSLLKFIYLHWQKNNPFYLNYREKPKTRWIALQSDLFCLSFQVQSNSFPCLPAHYISEELCVGVWGRYLKSYACIEGKNPKSSNAFLEEEKSYWNIKKHKKSYWNKTLEKRRILVPTETLGFLRLVYFSHSLFHIRGSGDTV